MILGIAIGFGAFLAISLIVNLFDPDFRESLARTLAGLFVSPLLLPVIYADDRSGPKARFVNPRTLQRFVNMHADAHGWAFSYKKRGLIVVRAPKNGE